MASRWAVQCSGSAYSSWKLFKAGKPRYTMEFTSIENGTLGSIRYTGATISKRSALKMYLRPYE